MGGGVSKPLDGGDASWLGVNGTTPTSNYGTFSPLSQPNNQGNFMGINGQNQNQGLNLGNGMFYSSGGKVYAFNPSSYLTNTLNPNMQSVNYTPSQALNTQLAQAMQMTNRPLPQRQQRTAPKARTFRGY